MTLSVNQLVEWANEDVMRVLWLDANNVVLIEVHSQRALPTLYSRTAVETALSHNQARIAEIDPYLPHASSEDQLTDAAQKRRDHAWATIRPLIEMHVPGIYFRNTRGKVVAAHATEVGVSKSTLYSYLRRFWQGGQIPNALLPKFVFCGGAGKDKSASQHKRGYPGRVTGINVDEDVRQRFEKGIKRFYDSGEVKTLSDAYQRTLEHYFNEGYEMHDGVAVPMLPSADRLPSLRQFRYWYHKGRNLTQTLVKREGQTRYNRDYRPLLGESTGMAFGPGSVYQIDATVGDVYLVSELNPSQIIGRPIIYLVVDVFSRMVVGLSVTLEGPSWLGAMLALENATTDKTAFCSLYGVSLDGNEWPCHHLPEMLLADRGELEGYNGDQIVHALNIVVSNTAPYRADMKGIVEQCFRLANLRVLNTLPGAVQEQKRGTRDYRLDAALTLSQLTTLLIRGILYHNRHHYMPDYPLDQAMLHDAVEPCPLDLWHWGVANRTGHLRTLPVETIRLSLLPQSEASVTRQGIRFRKLHYTSPTAVEAGWFVKAGQSGRWKVRVSYDPRLVDWLYVWHDGGRQVEACTLVNNTKMQVFRGLDWDTVQAHASYQKGQQQAARARQQQGRAVLNAHKDDVVQQAEAAQSGEKKKRKQVRDVIPNRQNERTRQRQEDAWRLVEAVEPEADEADEGYVPPAQYLDLLRGEEADHDND